MIKLFGLLWYRVELVAEKTKLLAFAPNSQSEQVYIEKLLNPLHLNGNPVCFSSTADHVGILRSVEGGNMPNILDRLSNHTKAVMAILPSGMCHNFHQSGP